MTKIDDLYKEAKLSHLEYRTYLVFKGDDIGREYLIFMLDSIIMEEPEYAPTGELFAWHDGRRSVWRDIKRIIDHVDKLIGADDDRSGKRKHSRS